MPPVFALLCARLAAFFSRLSAARARRCLAWIFLRRESVILGMGSYAPSSYQYESARWQLRRQVLRLALFQSRRNRAGQTRLFLKSREQRLAHQHQLSLRADDAPALWETFSVDRPSKPHLAAGFKQGRCPQRYQ